MDISVSGVAVAATSRTETKESGDGEGTHISMSALWGHCILRPRKKYGTVRGFTVVDPGGNWLRISKLGESEEEDSAEKAEGLAQIVYVAARLGDAHGDEALALKTLESGLTRFREASKPIDLARAYLSSGIGRSDKGPCPGSIIACDGGVA